jgi:predicted CXXCH cytochrome family protein
MHGAVRLGDCTGCHQPHSGEQPKLVRTTDTRALCFRCHSDDATGRAFVHKPVADGQCTACHDHHGSDNAFSLKAGEGPKLCYSCHKPVDTGRNKHAAIERHGCTACHDPHASGNRYQLAKPVNALCQGCHVDKTDGSHVFPGHPIGGGADPHDPTKDFSCVSCHDPHASDGPMLLRFGSDSMEVCDWCHGNKSGRHPEMPDIHRRGRERPAPR